MGQSIGESPSALSDLMVRLFSGTADDAMLQRIYLFSVDFDVVPIMSNTVTNRCSAVRPSVTQRILRDNEFLNVPRPFDDLIRFGVTIITLHRKFR